MIAPTCSARMNLTAGPVADRRSPDSEELHRVMRGPKLAGWRAELQSISERAAWKERLDGRDASHRAAIFHTHLTHGCIQHFCHFSRVRCGCGDPLRRETARMPPLFEHALRSAAISPG